MSLYPIIWAVEHAPVRDAVERAILSALVMKGDFDGCNCYRSYSTLAKVARVDPKTAGRKCRAMESRGILRRQTGPMPEGWKRLPKDKRPVVWEVMIPADFWSAVQLEEINHARRERGRPPITSESRPPLPDAPPKQSRSDKGKERPDRRKDAQKKRGDSQSPRSEEAGGTESPVAGGLRVPSRGDSQSPNPPNSPSDSPSSYATATSPAAVAAPPQEEESTLEARALALVDTAAARWDGHRLPTRQERRTLARRVAEALAEGAAPAAVSYVLTRDLEPSTVRTTAVQVVMARTQQPGWAEVRPPTSVPPPRSVPACEMHPGRARRPDGECAGCYVDRVAVS